jgi:hypothetical protein
MSERSQAVERFRDRFTFADREERLARASSLAASDEARLRECLDLHALNLLIDLERAKEHAGTLPEAIARTNADRLASAPMPPSLLSRWRRRGDAI